MKMPQAEIVRQEIRFASGDGECAATLLTASPDVARPCIILGNTMGATRADRLLDYAAHFASNGFAALAFDYRNFGESSGRFRQVCDIPGQIADFNAAIDFAKSRPEVDAHHIGLWGASLAGGHVVVVGARRRDIDAIVSFAPAADCAHIALHIGVRLLLRLVWASTRDVACIVFGAKPYTVPLTARPGQLGVMTTPHALDDYKAMVARGSLWRNAVAGRLFLRLPFYRPVRFAKHVAAPLLVGVCDKDDIAHPHRAAFMAALAPRGAKLHYPARHLSGFVGVIFDQSVADQTKFFKQHLLRLKGISDDQYAP
jgi:uncharacterized protein